MVDMRPQVGKDRYIWGQKLLDWIETVIAPEGGINTGFLSGYINDTLNAGTNISLSYDDLAGQITITNLITDEVIRDTVNALVAAGDGITVAYDDMANTLTISGDFTAIETEIQAVIDSVDASALDITALQTRTGTVLNTDGSFVDAEVMDAVVREGGPTGPEWSAAQADTATALVAAERADTRVFDVRAYGDIGPDDSDATANTAALIAAIAAANVVKGDVLLPNYRLPINALITPPREVGIIGSGFQSGFKATTTAAGLFWPDSHFIRCRDWTFDGDWISTAGVVLYTGNKVLWSNIVVEKVNGHPLRLHDVQNGSFDSIVVRHSLYGMWVDDGCGSNVFDALQAHNSTYYQLMLGNSGTVASGYAQPTSNTFINPMIEWIGVVDPPSSDAIATIIMTGSRRTKFINPHITPAYGFAVPVFKLNQVDDEVSLVLDTLDMANGTGVETAFELTGFTRLEFAGELCRVSTMSKGFTVDGTSARVLGNMPELTSVTTPTTLTGGAQRNNAFVNYRDYFLEAYRAPGWNDDSIRVGIEGEAGFRVFIAGNRIGMSNTPGYSPDAEIVSHATNQLGLNTGDSWCIYQGFLRMTEMTEPPAPALGEFIVFGRDNGAGKTQACVKFNTGAVQVIATEP